MLTAYDLLNQTPEQRYRHWLNGLQQHRPSMKLNQWIRVLDQQPAEDVKVLCLSPYGLECIMFRKGNMWLWEDGTYPYWTPLFWRPLEDKP